jgi:hypothetical protein
MTYLPIVLAAIFGSLSLLHFYWVFGGQWWLLNALPMNHDGQHVLKPSKVPTAIVGLGLFGFGLYYFMLLQDFELTMMTTIVGWIIPTIFLLRAIGDFKYVGFFKSVKGTEFAKYDNQFYAPLCLTIAVIGVTVAAQL